MMVAVAAFIAGCIFSPLAIAGAVAVWAIPRIRGDVKWLD